MCRKIRYDGESKIFFDLNKAHITSETIGAMCCMLAYACAEPQRNWGEVLRASYR